MDPEAVKVAGSRLRQVDVPDQVRLLDHGDGGYEFLSLGGFVEAEFHFFGIFGEQGEIDSLPVPGSPLGIGFAGVHFHGVSFP